VRPTVPLSNAAGFTVTEFLVAICILMVGLLALLQSVNIAIQTNSSNLKRSGAALLADQAMGRLRVMPFANLTSNGLRNITEYSTLTYRSYAGLSYVNYSVYDKVTKLANDTTNNAFTKNVQVVVAWREKGVRKTHALTTVIGNVP
jgi:Tfp pilus assembly protein PilV